MGLDLCYTNHAEADQDDMDTALTVLGVAGVNFIMGVPGADDIMLGYQSTSFHDALYARDVLGLRHLFDDLETKDGMVQLLDLAEAGSGVRIFIGSENKLFSLSGSSLVVAPYRDSEQRVIGALGVIGPTRLNYARIVPMVDYTAKVVSKVIGG